jgi:hypothetical protein
MEEYYDFYNRVLGFPARETRLGPAHSWANAQFEYSSLRLWSRPKMQRRLGWVEVLQILGGTFDAKQYKRVAPGLQHPYTIHQAYGLKIAQQLPRVLSQLSAYPDTRRALIYIGKPEDGSEREKPCIQMVNPVIRDGVLHLNVLARSWDLTYGFVYDTMVQAALCQSIAFVLNLLPGTVTFTAFDAHVYEKDIIKGPTSPYTHGKRWHRYLFPPLEASSMPERWAEIRQWALTHQQEDATGDFVHTWQGEAGL